MKEIKNNNKNTGLVLASPVQCIYLTDISLIIKKYLSDDTLNIQRLAKDWAMNFLDFCNLVKSSFELDYYLYDLSYEEFVYKNPKVIFRGNQMPMNGKLKQLAPEKVGLFLNRNHQAIRIQMEINCSDGKWEKLDLLWFLNEGNFESNFKFKFLFYNFLIEKDAKKKIYSEY